MGWNLNVIWELLDQKQASNLFEQPVTTTETWGTSLSTDSLSFSIIQRIDLLTRSVFIGWWSCQLKLIRIAILVLFSREYESYAAHIMQFIHTARLTKLYLNIFDSKLEIRNRIQDFDEDDFILNVPFSFFCELQLKSEIIQDRFPIWSKSLKIALQVITGRFEADTLQLAVCWKPIINDPQI